MDQWSIKFNSTRVNCVLCLNELNEGDGINLQLCSHCVCLNCLKDIVEAYQGSVSSCPKTDCKGYLLPGEVKTVTNFSRQQLNTPRVPSTKVVPSSSTRLDNAAGTRKVIPGANPKGQHSDSVTNLHNNLRSLNICFTTDPTNCEFCGTRLPSGLGIVLQSCIHTFCKDCLRSAIGASNGGPVPCPADACTENLLEKEIKALLSREAYEEYNRKGLLGAGASLPIFQCKTNGCSGLCLIESDSPKIFLCELCNRQNCLQCQAIHDGIPCEKWKKLRREADASISDEELLARSEDFGYSQLSKTVCEMLNGVPKEDLAGYYEAAGQVLEALTVVPTKDDFECMICTRMASEVPQGGIILQQCTHAFCRECLQNIIKGAEELPISCPYVDSDTGTRCPESLSAAEFKALAPPDVYDKHIRWGWSVAEDVIQKKFHCLQRGCDGFWEVSDDEPAGRYTCPLCSSENCVNCNVIHTGRTCDDYQEELRAEAERVKDEENRKVQARNEKISESEVNKLINQRQFMRCPYCGFVCEKISGCAHVKCLNRGCRRDFNWYH